MEKQEKERLEKPADFYKMIEYGRKMRMQQGRENK